MIKYIQILLVGIIVSFGFFPFSFFFFPELNTKNILAGLGVVLFLVLESKKKTGLFDYDFFMLLLYGGAVSFWGLIATGYNNTHDFTYTTYIISMLIWLSSSYTIISVMRWVHGRASVELVSNYLIGVCVFQCFLALAVELYPSIKHIVDSLQPYSGPSDIFRDRLYGIGCSLDVAGSRFAAVLVIIACLCTQDVKRFAPIRVKLYLLAFLIITVIGNMIARTTLVGVVLALIYWLYVDNVKSFYRNKSKIWRSLLIFVLLAIPLLTYLYHTNLIVHKQLEFAFEGFFSLARKGVWEVTSNERLGTMLVFPDSLKTWIIGDGYFDNPYSSDYYYIGPGATTEYYMYTDIGYLRFIFYFGLIGTLAFILYMLRVAMTCMRRFPHYRMMFVFILFVNYIVWCKVASDIFLVFALFLIVSKREYDQEIASSSKLGLVS